jgi:ADP-dependent NAD(P)H-hydrate dehydratase
MPTPFPDKNKRDKKRPAKKVTDRLLAGWPLPQPSEDGDKETRGSVLIVAGTSGMPGAGILASTAALRAGAGKLQVAAPKCVAPWMAVSVPESYVLSLPESRNGQLALSGVRQVEKIAGRVQALLIGPGMAGGAALEKFVERVVRRLSSESCLILDAAAMSIVTKKSKALDAVRERTIITPHAGEMAALLDLPKELIRKDPEECVVKFARKYGVTVALKGSVTWIADDQGHLFCNHAGNIGLATSGSGDTLSGLIAGLAARGTPPIQAAVWGVALHSRAGDILAKKVAPLGYLPRELLAEVPGLMANL